MGNERITLITETEKLFKKVGFDTSICTLRSCYDLIVHGSSITFLIKIIPNIDSISSDHTQALKCLCHYINAHPLIIGTRTKSEYLQRGVVHTRDDVPVLSIETLENTIVDDAPPLVYADRGGLYVRIEGEMLRNVRERSGCSLSEFAKELGVSRSTLYDYEHSTRGIEVDTAIKIEEVIDLPIIKPFNLLKNIIHNESKIEKHTKSTLEKSVFEKFDAIGLIVHPTSHTPFDAVIKEDENKNKVLMLTGISDMDIRTVKKRIMVVHDIAELLNKDAFFVLDTKISHFTIEGVPIVLKDEIKRLTDSNDIIEVIHERKKESKKNID